MQVYVFGGEGPRLRLQPGVSVLDLMTNEWSTLPWPSDARNAPEPRSALVATSYQDRYVYPLSPCPVRCYVHCCSRVVLQSLS